MKSGYPRYQSTRWRPRPHPIGGSQRVGWLINPPDSRRSALRALNFQDDPEGRAGSVLHMPSMWLVLRHALPVVLEGVVAPVAAYYCVLLMAGFRGALIGALIWSYLIVLRRLVRRERVSTLLVLGTVLLTMRTVIAFATGSVFLYFIQPTASAFLASLVLVGSALLGRPFTQRFTHDFCPSPLNCWHARRSTGSSFASRSCGRWPCSSTGEWCCGSC